MKLIHIGFAKTATTSLQRSIFPFIAQKKGLLFFSNDDLNIRTHYDNLRFGKIPSHKFPVKDNYIVSSELLYNIDPYFWEFFAKGNQLFFGADSHILITIREPKAYLTSIYLQKCLHEGNIITPDEFFLSDFLYSPYIVTPKFAISKFSYNRIINIYSKMFSKVTVIKYENIQELLFLKSIFKVSAPEILELEEIFRKVKGNRSYSTNAVKLTFMHSRILKFFGYKFIGQEEDDLRALKNLRQLFIDQEKMDKTKEHPEKFPKYPNFKLVRIITWRTLMQKYFDRFFPYQKYQLEFEKFPQIELKKYIREYKSIPNIETYANNS